MVSGEEAAPPDGVGPAALRRLRGVRLGRCARRILLLAPRPTDDPRIVPPGREGRAAAESHRRALRHLAATGLVELSWKGERQPIRTVKRINRIVWDAEAGLYRQLPPQSVPIERLLTKRAVRLTPLGALVVDQLRVELEGARRIRWASIVDTAPD